MQGRTRWRRWALTEADRLVLVFLAVLLANAGMNLVYTKDVIMSPSGALFGLAAAGVLGTWLGGESTARMRAGVTALVLVVAASWGVKVLGVHYSLRDSAHATRKAWVYADGWLERQEIDVSPARRRAIADALKADAIWRRPAAPRIQIHWPSSGAWFDTTQ